MVDHGGMTEHDELSPVAEAFSLLISALMRIDEILGETRDEVADVLAVAFEKRDAERGI